MKRTLIVLLGASILWTSLGCSSDPDAEAPIVILLDDAGTGAQTARDSGDEVEDASPPNSMNDADVVTDSPDLPSADASTDDMSTDEPTGNVCQSKEAPVQLIHTCIFEWSACNDSGEYTFRCDIKNLGGTAFSLCNCYEDGVIVGGDTIVDICGVSDWSEIEAVVNEECGWDLTTRN